MKASQATQLKFGLFILVIFVIILGLILLRQSNKNVKETEADYKQVLLGERSIGMLYNSIYGLHRDIKDLSLDSTKKDIGIEKDWIRWWELRATGLIDTVYNLYSGNKADVDSLRENYLLLKNTCTGTLELLNSNHRNEIINRTKTNGIISSQVQNVLSRLKVINDVTIKYDDRLYSNLYKLSSMFNKRIFSLIIVIFLFSSLLYYILTKIITRSNRTELLIKENEERFQLLFNHAPLGYQSLDINGNFIEVNQKWLDTLGYQRVEVIGHWFGDFLAPEFRDVFLKRFPVFKEAGKIHSEFEMLHKKGNKLFIAFDGNIGHNQNGEFKQTHCILQDITLQRQAEETLRKSEEKLRFFTDNSPMAVIEWDSNFNITRWSGDSEKIFGWTLSDVIGKNIMDINIIYEDDLEDVKTSIKVLRRGKLKQMSSIRNCRKDGKAITCDWYNTVLKNKAGEIESVLSQVLDNTEKMQSESALRESEKHYRSLFDNMLNCFAYCQMHYDMNDIPCDFTYLSVNKAFETQTGLLNAVGRRVTELIPTIDDKDKELISIYGQVSKNGEPRNFEIFLNSIKEWYSVSAYCPKYGYFVAVFEKITERKSIEINLASSNKFNSQIISSVQEGIIVYDKNLRYQVWNPFMEKITGIPASEAIGKLPKDIFSFLDDVDVIERLRKCLNGEYPVSVDFPFIVPATGKSGWASDKSIPFLDVNGSVSGVIGTVHDLTERKKNEIELIIAKEKAEESDHLKSAFLTNMSHEIRTPMNGILGFAELLKEPDLKPDEIRDYVQTIQISGARLLNTINSIIDISKIESGLIDVDMNETNVNEKIEFSYKFFKPEAEKKGLKLSFKNGLPENESIILTDNEKLYGILTNLIKNAIKFTYEGSVEFGYQKKGKYLEFYVKDTGVGIPEKQLEIIFQRFRQGSESHNRGYEGSGLGLSISKNYIEMLGGKIWVESQEGIGSTFCFTIPYNPAITTKMGRMVASSSNKNRIEIGSLKVLIAEDDEISFSLLKRTFQKFCRTVLHAETGIQAVEMCKNNRDIDLVLMDIRMPHMDGLEATRRIRQFNKDLIIIAQSAYGFTSDSEKALSAGCNDSITKPVDKTLLFELIDKHFH